MDTSQIEPSPNNQNLQLMTAQQVAKLLSTTPKTVYIMMQRGEIPSVRIGGLRRIRRVDLEKFIEEHMA